MKTRNRTIQPASGNRAATTRSRTSRGSTTAALSAAAISGWRRVCSWKPISRLASKTSWARVDRVDLEARLVVMHEGLAQVALPVGRFARQKALHEPGEGVRVDGNIPAARHLEAHELAADLLEHPEVATGNRGARPIQGGRRIDDLPHGPERIADREVRAESACLLRDLARGAGCGRRGSKRRLQRALEILLADRPSGLLRGPRRVRAPVGDGPEACRRRGREIVIGLRDLEVADHGIGHARDAIDVLGGQGTPGARWHRHGRPRSLPGSTAATALPNPCAAGDDQASMSGSHSAAGHRRVPDYDRVMPQQPTPGRAPGA